VGTVRLSRDHHWIDNAPAAPLATGTLPLVNPSTEEPIGTAMDGSAADVDAAVAAANRALHDPAWRDLTRADRARLLRGLADALDRRAGELADLISTQNGMPIKMVRWGNVGGSSASYRYFADLAEQLPVEDERVTPYSRTRVRREPIGTVGIIAPWNGPQILVAWKLGPALATGCTAVIKPAQETSLDAFVLAEAAAEAGFPPGVVNVVTGGRATGAALVEHPGVHTIAFTGSGPVGLSIIRAAAERLAALAPPGMPRPPAMMMALHIWAMSHGIASLFARGDGSQRKLPMTAEDLLEAQLLIYLRGLGLEPSGTASR